MNNALGKEVLTEILRGGKTLRSTVLSSWLGRRRRSLLRGRKIDLEMEMEISKTETSTSMMMMMAASALGQGSHFKDMKSSLCLEFSKSTNSVKI